MITKIIRCVTFYNKTNLCAILHKNIREVEQDSLDDLTMNRSVRQSSKGITDNPIFI